MLEKILETALPEVETVLKKNTSHYLKFLEKNWEIFDELLKQLSQDADSSDTDAFELHCKAFLKHNDATWDWLNAPEMETQALFEDMPWKQALESEESICLAFEDSVYQPFLEIPLSDSNSDSLLTKLNKKILAKRYTYQRNQAIKSASQRGEEENARLINMHQFLRFFIILPAARYMFDEWQELLSWFAKIIDQLHQANESAKDQLLRTELLEASNEDYWESLNSHQPQKVIFEYLQLSKTLEQSFNQKKEELEKKQKRFIEEIRDMVSTAWTMAGSPLLPNREFGERTIAARWQKLERHFLKASKAWENHLQGSNDEWLKDLELSRLQLLAARMYDETTGIIENKLNDKVLPFIESIKSQVHLSLGDFKKVDDISDEEWRKKLLITSRNLVGDLRQKKLPELQDMLIDDHYIQTFLGFFRRIENEIDQLPETHSIFADRDMQHVPPDSKMDEVFLKDILDVEILNKAIAEFEDIQEEFSLDMQETTRKVSYLDQIVEFNLDAAYQLLKERSDADALDEARTIAVSGLERTESNLDELAEQLQKNITQYASRFSAIARKLQLDIQNLADNEKIFELKLRMARARTKEKIRETRQKSWLILKATFPHIYHFITQIFEKTRQAVLKIGKATRLAPQVPAQGKDLTHYLIESYQKKSKMPYIYQRLFRLEALDERRFFYGREECMRQISEDFENFKQGYQAVTVIVSEKGNGKTTIVNFAEKEVLMGYRLVKIDFQFTTFYMAEFLDLLIDGFGFTDIQSIDEFEQRLIDLQEKYICVFENIHNLFLRIIDGFEVLDRFLLMMVNTRNNVYWLITSGVYAWRYLDRVIHISDYFRRVVFLSDLDVDDIEQIILTRHQVSGYGLHFEAPEKIVNSRQFKKLKEEEDRQNYLRKNFFKELTEISGGNIKSAILFWLGALEDFSEDRVTISTRIDFDQDSILRLTADELFTLAALIQHEYLNEEQHSLVFNQELNSSRALLGRLFKKGFLEKFGDNYSVHPFLYRPVVRALISKHILN